MEKKNSITEQEVTIAFDSIEYNYEDILINIENDLQNLSTEINSVIDYMQIIEQSTLYIAGFGLFSIIIILCTFIYKFFKIFI